MDEVRPTPNNILAHFSNIFNQIRQIPAVETARRFGVDFRKKGNRWVAPCPFHNDRNPSFFAYSERFHCFGCGWSGDAVDLVAELLGLRPFEAAQEIAGAFGLAVENIFSLRRDALLKYRQERKAAAERAAEQARRENEAYQHLAALYRATERTLDGIKTEDDLKWYGGLYHISTILEYLLESLRSRDPEERQAAMVQAKEWGAW